MRNMPAVTIEGTIRPWLRSVPPPQRAAALPPTAGSATLRMLAPAVATPAQRVRRAKADVSGVQKQRSAIARPIPTPIALATNARPKTESQGYGSVSPVQSKPVKRRERSLRRVACPRLVSMSSTLWPERMPYRTPPCPGESISRRSMSRSGIEL